VNRSSCDRCGGDDLLVLRFDGLGRATFEFCRACEFSQWTGEDESPMAVAEILAVAAAMPPRRRRGRRRD